MNNKEELLKLYINSMNAAADKKKSFINSGFCDICEIMATEQHQVTATFCYNK